MSHPRADSHVEFDAEAKVILFVPGVPCLLPRGLAVLRLVLVIGQWPIGELDTVVIRRLKAVVTLDLLRGDIDAVIHLNPATISYQDAEDGHGEHLFQD